MRLGWIAALAAVAVLSASAPAQHQGAATEPVQGGMRAKAPAKLTKDQMLKDANDITAAAQLPCAVTDANLLGEGKADIDGQKLDTKNYEVACQNGMGYVLSSSPPQPVRGFSCFAADHFHAKDPTVNLCSLPANTDLKAAAGRLLASLGTSCQPNGVNWIGITTGGVELIEVACTGGTGYIVNGPAPGKTGIRLTAQTCVEAAQQGHFCKLTSSGPQGMTADIAKQALAQHNVTCNAQNLRLMGKENALKRHLVEFQCPMQHPEGMVALIPLEDSTAPFETISCAQAAARYRAICTYVK